MIVDRMLTHGSVLMDEIGINVGHNSQPRPVPAGQGGGKAEFPPRSSTCSSRARNFIIISAAAAGIWRSYLFGFFDIRNKNISRVYHYKLLRYELSAIVFINMDLGVMQMAMLNCSSTRGSSCKA